MLINFNVFNDFYFFILLVIMFCCCVVNVKKSVKNDFKYKISKYFFFV